MRLDLIIDELISLIKSDEFFDDIRVMYAFPFADKPTRIKNSYLCLGINEITLGASQLDSSKRAGEIAISVNIYAPLNKDGRYLSTVLARLCACLGVYNVLSISATGISIDNEIQAYALNSKITLAGELDFGGGEND